MKRLLNTLYVTTEGAYLCQEGQSVVVRVERETRLRVPIHMLSSIVTFGQVSLSPSLLHFAAQHGVTVSFLSMYGRFLARVVGPTSGNVLLRRAQYRFSDNTEQRSNIAKAVVLAKIANCRNVIQRAARDYGEGDGKKNLDWVSKRLKRQQELVKSAGELSVLRGLEGEAAALYFSVFDHLVVAQKEDFLFETRSRRPPLDNVNALLSFLYTLLVHDIRGALESVGLDPQVGFLHADRPGRPSLALDLMEEFRPVVADRLALTLINLKQVSPRGFRKTESGAVEMDDETRKTVLAAYQKRKQDEVFHPFFGEKLAAGLLFHAQAMLLARHLRGDLDGYPPFFWR